MSVLVIILSLYFLFCYNYLFDTEFDLKILFSFVSVKIFCFDW